VTDQTAYVPAGTYSGNGEATVSAHAVNTGVDGNISAGDISGTCCREYILVKNNQPFTGGQNERDYQSVAKADIQNVVNTLSQQFQQTLQGKTTSLAPTSETLLTPIPCTSKMQSDHTVGAEAMQVSVTLHETCTPVSYNTQDFQSQAESTLSHVAMQTLGTGYNLLGNVETSIEKTILKNTSLLFTVVSNGMWVYQFNSHQLATRIIGKSQQDATALLQKQNSITHISIQVSGTKHDALPADPAQIHFLVFYEPV
jgi:VCBS repeat-containing protein